MSAIAIIPARGGSKRIPRKNIKPFLGTPVIAYSIRAAMESECFDEIMVSTDDAEIADIAVRSGAVVPFMRNAKTADDHSTLADVVSEVLASYSERNTNFNQVCCILPTSPLLDSRDIARARALLSSAPGVFSATCFGYPIWRALQVRDGVASMIWPEHARSRSQDLPRSYHDAGMFYWAEVQAFLEQRTLFLDGCRIWELPEHKIQDIDTSEDWRLAELKYAMLHETTVPTGDAT